MFSKVILMAAFMAILCHAAPPKTTTTENDPDYSGCDDTYQCFGIPGGCPEKQNCDVLLKTEPAKCVGDQSGADFVIYWKRNVTSDDMYVAVGLSEDDKMGDDSVTIFTLDTKSSQITETEGLTFAGDKFGVNIFNVTGFKFSDVMYKDGVLSGSFIRDEVTKVDKKTFDLKSYKYYILLAYGPVDDQGNVKHHDAASVSDKAVSLEGNSCKESSNGTSTVTTPSTTVPPTKSTTEATTAPPTTAATTAPPTTEATTAPPTTAEPTTDSGNGTTPAPTTSSNSSTTHAPTTSAPGSAATLTLNMVAVILVAVLIFVN